MRRGPGRPRGSRGRGRGRGRPRGRPRGRAGERRPSLGTGLRTRDSDPRLALGRVVIVPKGPEYRSRKWNQEETTVGTMKLPVWQPQGRRNENLMEEMRKVRDAAAQKARPSRATRTTMRVTRSTRAAASEGALLPGLGEHGEEG